MFRGLAGFDDCLLVDGTVIVYIDLAITGQPVSTAIAWASLPEVVDQTVDVFLLELRKFALQLYSLDR